MHRIASRIENPVKRKGPSPSSPGNAKGGDIVKKAYYAVFVPNDGKVSVFFPDFPGLFPWHETMEQAFQDAIGGLDVHMEGMADDGDEIPEPSSLDEAKVKIAESFAAIDVDPVDAVWQLVPAPDISEQQTRVNVSFKRYTLNMIDRKADAAGMTRSGFLGAAARE
jgi:predicted RNase H-like HicB family nuclease